MIKLVSTYSNITDVKSLSEKNIDQILTIIKNGTPELIAQIAAIRNITCHHEQNILNFHLPFPYLTLKLWQDIAMLFHLLCLNY